MQNRQLQQGPKVQQFLQREGENRPLKPGTEEVIARARHPQIFKMSLLKETYERNFLASGRLVTCSLMVALAAQTK